MEEPSEDEKVEEGNLKGRIRWNVEEFPAGLGQFLVLKLSRIHAKLKLQLETTFHSLDLPEEF